MKHQLIMASLAVIILSLTVSGKCDPEKTVSTSHGFTYTSVNGDSVIAQLRLMRIDADITHLYREVSHINVRIDSLIQAMRKRGR